MVIARRRLKRLRLPASASSLSVTRFDSGTRSPLRARTRIEARSAGSARPARPACTSTSYSSPSCTKVVTWRLPIIVSSARPMSVTLTPRSEARAVDLHAHLRAGFLVVRIDREEAGVGLIGLAHDVAPLADL